MQSTSSQKVKYSITTASPHNLKYFGTLLAFLATKAYVSTQRLLSRNLQEAAVVRECESGCMDTISSASAEKYYELHPRKTWKVSFWLPESTREFPQAAYNSIFVISETGGSVSVEEAGTHTVLSVADPYLLVTRRGLRSWLLRLLALLLVIVIAVVLGWLVHSSPIPGGSVAPS